MPALKTVVQIISSFKKGIWEEREGSHVYANFLLSMLWMVEIKLSSLRRLLHFHWQFFHCSPCNAFLSLSLSLSFKIIVPVTTLPPLFLNLEFTCFFLNPRLSVTRVSLGWRVFLLFQTAGFDGLGRPATVVGCNIVIDPLLFMFTCSFC